MTSNLLYKHTHAHGEHEDLWQKHAVGGLAIFFILLVTFACLLALAVANSSFGPGSAGAPPTPSWPVGWP